MEKVIVWGSANCPSTTSLIILQCTCAFIITNGASGLWLLCNVAPQIGQLKYSMWLQCVLSSCSTWTLPAGTPSFQGQRCCPSSAWWGPAGGGHDTVSPRVKGYSWAPLSWQPFSTATGPLLHPARGRKEGSEQPGCEITVQGRKEGEGGVTDFLSQWPSREHREVTEALRPLGPSSIQAQWRQ